MRCQSKNCKNRASWIFRSVFLDGTFETLVACEKCVSEVRSFCHDKGTSLRRLRTGQNWERIIGKIG
jgi:hypothetical protein